MDRIILHSDCNCFYASVEMLHHPELEGLPLAVGGDPEARHGIVLTANYIAKRKGVKTRRKGSGKQNRIVWLESRPNVKEWPKKQPKSIGTNLASSCLFFPFSGW